MGVASRCAAAPLLAVPAWRPGRLGVRRSVDGTWRDLERDWLVVDWDQPGAGRSYRGDETSTTLSLETLVDDGVALVELLAADYGDRPVVLGRSLVRNGARRPDRRPRRGAVSAYVGAAQVVNWALQEERSYDWARGSPPDREPQGAGRPSDQIGRPVAGPVRRRDERRHDATPLAAAPSAAWPPTRDSCRVGRSASSPPVTTR